MKYNVLYIDPPYRYRNRTTGGSLNSGSKDKYPTLSLSELGELPIPDIADRDSVIFLWATVPLLPDGLMLMRSWHFRYRTMLTWHKTKRLGLGYWFRGVTEHLLLGMRGKVKAFRCQKPNFHQCKALKHSQKPDYFRELIEEATSDMRNPRRLELFATKEVTGWTCLGNEIDGRDIRDSLEELLER